MVTGNLLLYLSLLLIGLMTASFVIALIFRFKIWLLKRRGVDVEAIRKECDELRPN